MKLSELFKGLDVEIPKWAKDLEVTGITSHSKRVRPGNLFIAKCGNTFDGSLFIPEALEAGATVALAEFHHPDILTLVCPNISKIEKQIISRFYKNPSESLFLVGVTGTNGKTTTSFMIKKILEKKNNPCGVMGTLGCFFKNQSLATSLTTPDLATSYQLISEMKKNGCKSIVMEVSSHALDQNRIAGMMFEVAVFTNFSHEHLDYHKTMDNYFSAKCKLFEGLSKDKIAVLNADDPSSDIIAKRTKAAIFRYALHKKADLIATNIQQSLYQTSFTIQYGSQTSSVSMPIMGYFNVYNALAAISVGIIKGIPMQEIQEHLSDFTLPRGRLEPLYLDKGPHIFIDFAHKPKAFEEVLKTLSFLKKGKLITIFGCGGDRDREKRPMMAKIAEMYSDIVFVTSDNPRKEDPGQIIQEIILGFQKDTYIVEQDRRKAIEKAVQLAYEEDIIIIAGKGHETIQILPNQTIPFDDREIAKEILSQKL